MCFQQSIAVDIGERRGEVKHLVFGKVKRIPEILELDARVLNEEVQVLSLQLIQPCELVLELIDLSHSATSVLVEKDFGLAPVNAQLCPERLDGGFQVAQLALAVLLLIGEPIT